MLSNSKWILVFVLYLLGLAFVATPVLAGKDKGGLYVRGGVGAIFFNPPDHVSFPFHEFDRPTGTIGGRVQSPLEFEPEDTTAAWNFAFGYRFSPSRTANCLGQDLRVELSSNFYFPEDSIDEATVEANGSGWRYPRRCVLQSRWFERCGPSWRGFAISYYYHPRFSTRGDTRRHCRPRHPFHG